MQHHHSATSRLAMAGIAVQAWLFAALRTDTKNRGRQARHFVLVGRAGLTQNSLSLFWPL